MMPAQFFHNPNFETMPKTADVVIIGGGPAGAGALWALERAQPGVRAVLIEKNDQLAAGTSMASLENYRSCWAAPALAALMLRSIDVFYHADEYLGEGTRLGVKAQGYLYCGVNTRDAARLRAEVDHLHTIGLPHIEFLDADAIRHRFPWLGGRVVAGKFDPMAGWLDSNGLIHALAKMAHNATVLLGITETRILTDGGRITGVQIPNGTIHAPRVILAAGPNARAIGRTAGIELPLVVRPRQSFTTPARGKAFPSDAPMIIGSYPFPHVRPEAHEGAIFGWEYHWNSRRLQPDHPQEELIDPIYPVDRWKDPRFPSMVLTLFARQMGEDSAVADMRALRGVDHRAGYYTFRDVSNAYMTGANGEHIAYESQRAILDNAPGIDGLTLSVAHVGHGIMSAPAAGEIVAAKALGLPLPNPVFADFGYDVPFVAYDSGGLSSDTLLPVGV